MKEAAERLRIATASNLQGSLVKRFASVRFGGVLDSSERAVATREVVSAGAAVRSWKTTGTRTYATVDMDGEDARSLGRRFPAAKVDAPALTVLRIVPDARRHMERLAHALGGAGRPSGVREAYRDGDDALVIEIDTARTPLAFVAALIDAELPPGAGRTLEPLVALDDDALTAFAGDVLAMPGLGRSRVIETHLETILAGSEG